MDENTKQIAYQAVNENVEDTTARQVIRYVMECELWGQDIIAPKRGYLAKKYGWSLMTEDSAIKRAKKSEFITTTGYGKTRCFELNVGFLKGKIAEIVGRNTRPKLRLSELLPPSLPPTLPLTSPLTSPLTLHEENGSTEPSNGKKGGYNNNNNNNRERELPQKEINHNLGFPLPDGWTDDSYIDSDGSQIPMIKGENGQKIKQSEITQMRKQYEISLKSQKTRQENQDPEVQELITTFKNECQIDRFDKPVDYKIVKSVADKINDYTKDEETNENLKGLLRKIHTKSPFHWRNLTDFGYLDRNFTKIIREVL